MSQSLSLAVIQSHWGGLVCNRALFTTHAFFSENISFVRSNIEQGGLLDLKYQATLHELVVFKCDAPRLFSSRAAI